MTSDREIVLRELVSVAGADGRVAVDAELVERLEAHGILSTNVASVVDQLHRDGCLDREAEDIYRVTRDGLAASPAALERIDSEGSMTKPVHDSADHRVQVQHDEEDEMRLLAAVIALCESEPNAHVASDQAYSRAGLDLERGRRASGFLQREGLLLGRPGHRLSPTHNGVVEYRSAVRHPARETEHFTSTTINNVINVDGANYGAIQTGAGHVATTTNKHTVGLDTRDLASAIVAMRSAVEGMDKTRAAEASGVIDAIEQHAAGANRNVALIKGYAEALRQYSELVPFAVALLHLFGVNP